MPQDWFSQFETAAPAKPKASDDWFSQFQTVQATPQRRKTDRVQLPEQSPSGGWPATIGDLFTGVVKGAGQTVSNLGRLIHAVPGVSGAIDTLYGEQPGFSDRMFSAADAELEPTNTAQRVGKVGEQIVETLVPATKAAKLGQGLNLGRRAAVEGGVSAATALAQGGDPTIAGVIGGAVPVVGRAVQAAAPALRQQATKQAAQALGATKERYKAMSERLAPELLKRGIRGSREQIQAQAAEAAEIAGDQIDQAIQMFGHRTVDATPVLKALDDAKGVFQTPTTMTLQEATKKGLTVTSQHSGNPLEIVDAIVPLDPRALKQLDGLQTVVTNLGNAPRVDQLIAVRRAWDRVVDQAGGYAHRAPGAIGVPLKDATEAQAKREGANAIRALLATEVPELAALNKEFAFWKSLDDVVTQTLKRTQPQQRGLGQQVAQAAGQAVGGAIGASSGTLAAGAGAIAGGRVNAALQATFNSARWKLASAALKNQLADAIMSDQPGKIMAALAKIGAVQGSKLAVP